jgi:hypothetical protein
MSLPKTIQIFLPDGDPKSVKIAEITSRTVQAVLVPRAMLNYMNSRTELFTVGVYFLFGAVEDLTEVYVGEAEDCGKRLSQHNSGKDFWTHALVFSSQKQQFTKSHVKYLEWLCLAKVKTAERSNIQNSVIPAKPYIPEPVEADMRDCYETIEALTAALGFPVLDKLRSVKKSAALNRLFLKTKTVDAEGEFGPEGFTVLKGAKCAKSVSKSYQLGSKKRRDSLIEQGLLKLVDQHYVLVKDLLFASPSGAAAIVLARENNGWTTWKYGNGKTMDAVLRNSQTDEKMTAL